MGKGHGQRLLCLRTQETVHLYWGKPSWLFQKKKKPCPAESVLSFFLMACWHSDFLFEGRKRGDEARHTVKLILTLSLCPLCRSRGTTIHDDAKHLHGQFQLLSSRQWCAIPKFRTDCFVSGFVPVATVHLNKPYRPSTYYRIYLSMVTYLSTLLFTAGRIFLNFVLWYLLNSCLEKWMPALSDCKTNTNGPSATGTKESDLNLCSHHFPWMEK